MGSDTVAFAVAMEELSVGYASAALSLIAHTMTSFTILAFGTENAKAKHLPGLTGEKLGAFGVAEPSAGTDTLAIETFTEREGRN